MLRKVRNATGVQILASAMGLLLAFVTIWGSFAHASHGAHHAELMTAAAYDHGTAGHTAADQPSVDADGRGPVRTPVRDTHNLCADLICHGGIAIIAIALPVNQPPMLSEVFVMSHQSMLGFPQALLDRPPRTVVRI